MRWFIEVSRVDEDAIDERLCVEARRWQEALQRVREYRGDSAPLSSFSIELFDNGYRAVDPAHEHRYVVERAPSDAPLSAGVPESARPSSRAPRPSSGVTSRTPRAPSLVPATRELGLAEGGLVRFQEIQRRFEEPTADVPISYREIAYGVAPGTSKQAIEQLLFDRLGRLRSELDGRRGCYVQLAVFDHVWVRRPIRPPLATLAWKDWRGKPELTFPGSTPTPGPGGAAASESAATSRASAQSIAPSRVISTPPSAAPEEAPHPPGAASGHAEPATPATATERSVASTAPASSTASNTEQRSESPAVSTTAMVAVEATLGVATGQQANPKTGEQAHLEAKTSGSPEAPATSMPEAEAGVQIPSEAAEVATAEVGAAEVGAAEPQALESGAAEPEAVQPAASKPAGESAAPPRLVLAEQESDSSPNAARRASDTDLIGELFETLHELHFCTDVVSGADFVIKLITRTFGCRRCFVHIFDIDARNFVLVRQAGADASLLLTRTPDKDPLFDQVMHAPAAVKVDDAASDPRFQSARWLVGGAGPRSVLLCAAHQGGRYLGLVELADPMGGAPFSEVEANALEYLCGQFGEFIAERPLVLDDDVVLANR